MENNLLKIKQLVNKILVWYGYSIEYHKEHNALVVDCATDTSYRGVSSREDYHFEYVSSSEYMCYVLMLIDWLPTLKETNEDSYPNKVWSDKELQFIEALGIEYMTNKLDWLVVECDNKNIFKGYTLKELQIIYQYELKKLKLAN